MLAKDGKKSTEIPFTFEEIGQIFKKLSDYKNKNFNHNIYFAYSSVISQKCNA